MDIASASSLLSQVAGEPITFGSMIRLVFSFGIPTATLIGLVKVGITIGEFKATFNSLKESTDKLNSVVTRLNSCVQEIQSVMKNKYKSLVIAQETIDLYGIANSPIVLKDEFRDLIQESGLAYQVEEQKEKLVKWLKKKGPKTGLDAQEALMDLAISNKVEEYLDTREFKKILYENGKTIRDYYVILAIYLFETIIPEVVDED